MFEFFANCRTVEDVKKAYRDYALKFHPDIHGDKYLEQMKRLNVEYEKAFKLFENQHSTTENANATENAHTTENPNIYKDIIDRLICLDGVEIEICGSWIWLHGNTYPHRETLKSLGFRYSSAKKSWYYGSGNFHKGRMTMNQIRQKYGSTNIASKSRTYALAD